MTRLQVFLILFAGNLNLAAQVYPTILDQRKRAQVINEVLADRFEHLLPQLMRREGFDMWILISREYNEDPVMKTMLPAFWMH